MPKEDKKIVCPYCIDETFNSKTKLRIHIAKWHYLDVFLDWKKYGPSPREIPSEEEEEKSSE